MGETVSTRVARIEENLKAYHDEVTRLLNDEIKPIKETQKRHTEQITFWRGGLALLGIAWAGLLAYLGGHKH